MQTHVRTFRVFISSTFADFRKERDALHEHVFPKLRALAEEHGCRFQAIDLRWGVREEAGLDQQTMRICLDEIARCQRFSPRPSFVILVGDRYGWRPIPWEIPVTIFERVQGALEADERSLIDDWYERDDNAVPPVCFLRPRKGEYADPEAWRGVESRILCVLDKAFQGSGLPGDLRERYLASATELEARTGVLEAPVEAGSAFAFFRQIEDLPTDTAVTDYVDLLAGGSPDVDARRRLERVKQDLRARLPGQVHEWTARWRGGELSVDHLGSFCDGVYRSLADAIRGEVAKSNTVDELEQEVAAHVGFGLEHTVDFVGRSRELVELSAYFREPECTPLAVIGDSGAGKTAFMARAAEGRPDCVRRFIGATPASTDLRSLLRSLILEIHKGYARAATDESSGSAHKLDRELPDDILGLARRFESCLALASAERPLIVLLDAVNQLSASHDAHRLSWLPAHVPPHVALVVSTASGPVAEALQRRLPSSKALHLESLSLEEAGNILDRWLARAQRVLQPTQRAAVLEAFAAVGLPLHLRLAFERARLWRSSQLPDLGSSHSIDEMVLGFLEQLAGNANHGRVLVERTLAYLAASRHGLSEDELVDLLSLDPQVFPDFVQRAKHRPPANRLPVSVWSRLHLDLSAYLSRRVDASGSPVLGFFHHRFYEIVRDRFLGAELLAQAGKLLTAYFSFDPESDQDLRSRRLTELPYHALRSSSWDTVRNLLGSLSFVSAKCTAGMAWELAEDYRSANAALASASRFGESPETSAARIVDSFSRAFGQEMATIWLRPDQAAPQMYNRLQETSEFGGELQGRLETFAARGSANGTWLRRLNRSQRTGPSSALRYSVGAHQGSCTALASLSEHLIATGGEDGYVRVWDLREGVMVTEARLLEAAVATICALAPARNTLAVGFPDGRIRLWNHVNGVEQSIDPAHRFRLRALAATGSPGRLAAGGEDGLIRIVDIATARQVGLLRQRGRVLSLCEWGDGTRVVAAGDDGALRIWETGAAAGQLPLKSFRGHQGPIRSVDADPRGRLLVSGGSDGTLRMWDPERVTQVHRIETPAGQVRCVAVGAGESPLAASGGDDGVIRLWDTESGEEIRTLLGHVGMVTGLAFPAEGGTLASVGLDGTLRIWDSQSKTPGKTGWEHESRIVAMAAPGELLASASADGRIGVWSRPSLDLQATLRGHFGPVTSLSPLGSSSLISGGEDRTIRIWTLQREDGGRLAARCVTILGDKLPVELTRQNESGRGSQQNRARIRAGHDSAVTAVCCAGVDQIVSGGADATLRLWDISKRAQLAAASISGRVAHLAFDPGSASVVASTGSADLFQWRFSESECRRFDGHTASVTMITDSRNGVLYSSSLDGTVRAWRLAEGDGREIVRHGSPVTALVRSASERICASGSFDGRLVVWNPDGKTIAEVKAHSGPVLALAFSEPARHLYSTSRDGEVRAWRLPDLALKAILSTGVRPVTLQASGEQHLCLGGYMGGLCMLALQSDGSSRAELREDRSE